jgi:hypothetical protein
LWHGQGAAVKKPDYSQVTAIIVALPVMHLLASSIFLWGYSVGFGSGLSAFAAPTDIFRVSIKHLVLLYLSVGSGAAILLSRSYIRKKRSAGINGDNPVKSNIGFGRIIGLILIVGIGFILPVAYVISCYYFDRPVRIAWATAPVLATAIMVLLVVSDHAQFDELKANAITVAALVFLMVLVGGLDKGHLDRTQSYEGGLVRFSRCNDLLIMKAFSDFYLAIKPDNTKVLIDADCKVKFSFPATRYAADRAY